MSGIVRRGFTDEDGCCWEGDVEVEHPDCPSCRCSPKAEAARLAKWAEENCPKELTPEQQYERHIEEQAEREPLTDINGCDV